MKIEFSVQHPYTLFTLDPHTVYRIGKALAKDVQHVGRELLAPSLYLFARSELLTPNTHKDLKEILLGVDAKKFNNVIL